MRSILFCLVVVLIFSSCKKDKTDSTANPPTNKIPAITLVSVKPTTVHQLSDSIVFTIHYTDGDGDLGFENADSMSLVLTDNRFPLDMLYHVQPLSPSATTIAITGDLPIVLNNTILENSAAAQETATFNIRIKDRAGNWSNTITTGNITVLP